MDRMDVINAELERLHESLEELTDAAERCRVQTQIDCIIAQLGGCACACAGEAEEEEVSGDASDVSSLPFEDCLGEELYNNVIESIDGFAFHPYRLGDVYPESPEELHEVEILGMTLFLLPDEHRKAFADWQEREEEE
jgi:hypothetical protein